MIPICLAIAAVLAILKIAGVAVVVTLSWGVIAAVAAAGFVVPFLIGFAIIAIGLLGAFLAACGALIVGVFQNLGSRRK